MEGTLLIAIAILIFVVVLRVVFKVAGWILKLLVVAALGFAIWWVFSGM